MTIGVVGRKVGMTRIFTDDGVSLPVTVIEVEPNRITQLKTLEADGYRAVQVTTGTRKANRVTKPMAGHFAKAKTEAGRGLWEFRLSDGDATHGNSLSHRAPGSIGQNQTPGRVFPGKKMAGHLGNVRRTQQNLEVVRVDTERNLLLVKGAVPGAKGGSLIVRPAVKIKREAK
ncbi:MAG: 50S ribosomal protein L3 [Gammaproteobacteria bacterium]